ncbi:hypothetical protein BGW80DRAFT_1465633 [Lactifluus volemus]|nr:hypothetical protein BGW80DRAFT_1465633 [Lactifluus volemus]
MPPPLLPPPLLAPPPPLSLPPPVLPPGLPLTFPAPKSSSRPPPFSTRRRTLRPHPTSQASQVRSWTSFTLPVPRSLSNRCPDKHHGATHIEATLVDASRFFARGGKCFLQFPLKKPQPPGLKRPLLIEPRRRRTGALVPPSARASVTAVTHPIAKRPIYT